MLGGGNSTCQGPEAENVFTVPSPSPILILGVFASPLSHQTQLLLSIVLSICHLQVSAGVWQGLVVVLQEKSNRIEWGRKKVCLSLETTCLIPSSSLYTSLLGDTRNDFRFLLSIFFFFVKTCLNQDCEFLVHCNPLLQAHLSQQGREPGSQNHRT